ncbi:MAG: AarF/UbiB family protein [Myxococcota bacterium]
MVSLINTVRDLERLRQISVVLARHGFEEVVERTGLGSLLSGSRGGSLAGAAGSRTAATRASGAPEAEDAHLERDRYRDSGHGVGVRIRRVLQDLGPCFIKLGQILSTRTDLIPGEILRELKKLQDDVPPDEFELIRSLIESELGASLEEIFLEFDQTPLASASIGQVHRAKLALGGDSEDGVRSEPVEVVVKAQRRSVRQVVDRDLDLLHLLARAIERSIPESRVYHPVQLVAEFDRAIRTELDYASEADHAERFRQHFRGAPHCVFPRVYRNASSRRVLTLEYLPGQKIDEALAAGFAAETIVRLSLDIVIKQIFEDGFFHADPHPGNVLVLGTPSAPTLGLIDLGMVGRLSPKMRDRTVDLMVAAATEDYPGIANALYALGSAKQKIDREAFEAEVTTLAQKYLGKPLKELELSGLISDLIYVGRTFGLEIPPEFLMVGKTLMTVEGVGKQLCPDLDVFEEIKPYFIKLLQQRYAPERITQEMLRGIVRLSGVASNVPLQTHEILEDLRKGSFQLQIRDDTLLRAAETLGRRLGSAMITAAAVAGGVLAWSLDRPVVGTVALTVAFGWAVLTSWRANVRKTQRRVRQPRP